MTNINKVKSSLQRQLDDIKKISGINSLILSVCLVDTLSGFYSGYDGKATGGNKKRYEKFVDKYLPVYKPYLYNLRCNLTHSFSNTVANFTFVDNIEFTKVFGSNITILGSPIFNVDIFKKDLEVAFNSYFHDLIANIDEDIQKNFQTRHNSFGILQDGVIGTVRNMRGELINHIDQADRLPNLDIRIISVDPTQIKR